MIRQELTQAGYSRMTVSRYLPSSAKHMEKSGQGQRNKMLPSRAKLQNKTCQFTGKITKLSRGRHNIILPAKMDVSKFQGKEITVTISL
jgi:hypothetical protein